MKNLIAIPDHSEYLEKTFKFEAEKWDMHMKRVRFGKQPLELWMFVPCELVEGIWVVLEKPKFHYTQEALKNLKIGIELNIALEINKKVKEYQKAQERVLFEVKHELTDSYPYKGVNIHFLETTSKIEYNISTKRFFFGVRTIEDLCEMNAILTKTALKQLSV